MPDGVGRETAKFLIFGVFACFGPSAGKPRKIKVERCRKGLRGGYSTYAYQEENSWLRDVSDESDHNDNFLSIPTLSDSDVSTGEPMDFSTLLQRIEHSAKDVSTQDVIDDLRVDDDDGDENQQLHLDPISSNEEKMMARRKSRFFSYDFDRVSYTLPIGKKLKYPHALAVSQDGRVLYIADTGHGRILGVPNPHWLKKRNDDTFIPVKGLGSPKGLTIGEGGNLFICDTARHQIILHVFDTQSTTVIGGGTPGYRDGSMSSAKFRHPVGISYCKSTGQIFICDSGNFAIRVVEEGCVRTIAGGNAGIADGLGTHAQFMSPYSLSVSSDGTEIYVADPVVNSIRLISLIEGDTTRGKEIYGNKTVYDEIYETTTIVGVDHQPGYVDQFWDTARSRHPMGVAVNEFDHVFFCDTMNNAIRRVKNNVYVRTIAGGETSRFIGGSIDGADTDCYIRRPVGIAVVPRNGRIYVTEPNCHRIRLIERKPPEIEEISARIKLPP
ncbi:hypothetical protein AAMO2058_000459800 [Amorphochlora amoebiformis]